MAHFRAHWNALAALEFDASGTLLVTAAVDGQTFNVYALQPSTTIDATGALVRESNSSGVDSVVPRQLYRLVGGFTNAAIQVSFASINFYALTELFRRVYRCLAMQNIWLCRRCVAQRMCMRSTTTVAMCL